MPGDMDIGYAAGYDDGYRSGFADAQADAANRPIELTRDEGAAALDAFLSACRDKVSSVSGVARILNAINRVRLGRQAEPSPHHPTKENPVEHQ